MSAPLQTAPVFEFLDKTHREIQQQIRHLHQLVDAIAADGLTAAHRSRARSVLDYFNAEARQHHLDEEKHIFPSLLASHDQELVQAAEHLIQDHGWLEENWLQIEPAIEAATQGNFWFDIEELRHALDVFEALYTDHILLEESLAYPAARQRLAAGSTFGIGREMARRRLLVKPEVVGARAA
jgi:hemerythrin-like domain-containing protein